MKYRTRTAVDGNCHLADDEQVRCPDFAAKDQHQAQ